MKFRTEINLNKSRLLIDHKFKIATIGSCFAENIGEYFKYYRFGILDNPFGVLYNPVSINNALKLLVDKKIFSKDDLFYDQGEWHSFHHHSDFSHHDAATCLENINNGLIEAQNFLSKADVLIITFGTAYVYKHTATAAIVSNCHKISANQFERFRLTVEDVKQCVDSILGLLEKLNDKLKIIFTVSPVRHLKDGAVDNQISKSILLLAVNDAIKEKGNCVYFPSYEIMMDDLRDYRFYESDLVHPNKIATDYIWQKFISSHLSSDCENILKEIEPVAKARLHRTRNIYSETNKKFVQNQIKRIEDLEKKHIHLSLVSDKIHFQKILDEIENKAG